MTMRNPSSVTFRRETTTIRLLLSRGRHTVPTTPTTLPTIRLRYLGGLIAIRTTGATLFPPEAPMKGNSVWRISSSQLVVTRTDMKMSWQDRVFPWLLKRCERRPGMEGAADLRGAQVAMMRATTGSRLQRGRPGQAPMMKTTRFASKGARYSGLAAQRSNARTVRRSTSAPVVVRLICVIWMTPGQATSI